MLPISLIFEGLNSYAREVKIDFTKFYRTKLFGIFGITGGGKSTILDAIILSIYGKTPRLASTKIKEAINPQRGVINIEFTFEIGRRRFKIQRGIDQRETQIRLYRLEEDKEIPIAEKSNEFNEKIKEIIGLSYEEFCKVVILPQNQFAELLRLEPAKRAELIGNLFDLNYFGEPLYSKFSEKFLKLESTIQDKQRRLNELSEISQESIINKEREVDEITKALGELRQKQKELMEKLNILRNFKQLSDKKKELERELQKMETKKIEIESLKNKIQMDDELAPYKKSFEELKNLKKSIEANKQKHEELARELKIIESRFEKQREQKEEFEKFFSQRNEELIGKIKESEQLVELEQEIKSLLDKEQQRAKEMKKLNLEFKEVDEQLKRIDTETTQLMKNIEKNKALFENTQLNDEELRLYDLLPNALLKLNEIKNLKEEIEILIKKTERERKKWEESFAQIQKEFRDRFNLTIATYEEIDSVIVAKTEEIKELKDKLLRELDEFKVKNLAFTLSKTLLEGKPCPVCGSTEHPKPAESIDDKNIALREEKLKEVDENIFKIEDVKAKIKPLMEKVFISKTNIETYAKEISDKKSKLTKAEHELSQIISVKLWANAEQLFEQIKNKKKKNDEVMKELNYLNSEFHEKMKLKNDVTQKRVEIFTKIQQTHKELEEIKKDTKEKKDKLNEKTGGKTSYEIKTEAEKELEIIKKRSLQLENELKDLDIKKQNTLIAMERITEGIKKDEQKQKEIKASLDLKAKEMRIDVSELAAIILDEETKKSLKNTVEEFEKEFNKAKGALDNILKNLEEIPIKAIQPDELQETEKFIAETNDKIAQSNEKLGTLKEQIRKEKDMLKEKQLLSKEITLMENEFENVKLLKNLTYGKEMVKFFSWQLLKEIVKLTNGILRTLIGRRFSINVNPNLEFTVSDLLYNKERSVNTLSGGETFIVSFALALALSSYIQSKRMRAIQFFFIDEGFSSLDRELLDSVCAVLNELKSQDRLVGLISHIEELKQVIPNSINIKRDITGSSIVTFNV
ncbi:MULTISPECIES: AAA family ATPase [Thermodesulfovibrio]|uniref:ATPase involved in DNA repair, putative n=1 Tax=Thermodesulfovibrio yellowstonii (strain ATCC 51303 / DSM 11347 / YP87) TaxID=289376 RepID=B5YJS0_THEYD|nr:MULTISPECIES: SbcC/MukB-like Walker B domain-containing protein [Thermodesulfovibrio]ACI21622.1 ATPase involved in DNA repair, putative [Thermodesulfovibrio yellowstonii DSM 11347]MBC7189361.1 AAA family ATPase [Candidatus Aerophobetes bacterium]